MKQHSKPCAACPFSRTCPPGTLGGSPVEMYIGQAFGAFWLPCHECIDYTDPNWRLQYHASQCAGAAIYRANCHPYQRPNSLLKLDEDKELVFASPAEFMAHHLIISVREAEARLYHHSPMEHWMDEMLKTEARIIKREEFA